MPDVIASAAPALTFQRSSGLVALPGIRTN